MKVRALAFSLVAALVCGLVAPLGAQTNDPRAQRDAVRARQAELAAKLDGLKASEAELLAAAAVLDDQVLAQAARVDAARQALAMAEAEVVGAVNAIAQTRSLITELERLFVARAVQAYISPRRARIDDLISTTDLAEGARRHALLDSVAASDGALLEELGAAREDFEVARAAAEAAEAKAAARKAETEEALARLERDRASKRRLQQALTTRQREVLAEIDAHAAAESTLTRIIREREQAARAAGATGNLPVGRGGCMWPTQGRVTSEYGRRWGRMHQGIDIAAPTGTAIYAAAAGEVIFAGRMNGYGNTVMVDHGGGFTTLYGHQSRILVGNGQSVSRGARIGSVGNTGRSTGPHLHFETRYGGAARNPRGCLG
ncbi:MAG TPA: peptidoglycan DD-metalloendopeptidase family protein [Acidimicrobiales bacterium]|nr:peptidoglycan DD-metalloendopeptidase family protein [Acidimicrobiales bacterium]